MYIDLKFIPFINAVSKEKQLYKKTPKDVTVDWMIIQSLNSTFKIINPELLQNSQKQLDFLINLINNDPAVQFNMLALDISGWWFKADKAYKDLHNVNQTNDNNQTKVLGDFNTIGGYIKACQKYQIYSQPENPKVDANIPNLCLVFRLSKQIDEKLNGLNSIAIFCDLVFNPNRDANNIVQGVSYELVIKRIELLEISAKISDSTLINIRCNNPNFVNFDPNFIAALERIHPEIEFGKKQDSQLRKFLRYDDWNRLIPALRNYYNKKNNDDVKNYQKLLFFDQDTKFSIDDLVECYILHKKDSPSIFTSKSNKYYLINKKDENIKYHINVSKHEDALRKLIEMLNQEKERLEEEAQKLRANNDSINQSKDKLTSTNNDIDKEILSKNNDLLNVQNELKELEDLQKQNENKSNSAKTQIESLQAWWEKLKKSIENDNQKIKTINIQLGKLNQEDKGYNEKQYQLTQALNQLNDKNQKNQKEFEEIPNQISIFEKDKSKFDEQIKELLPQLKRANDKLKNKQNEIDALKKRFENNKKDITEFENEIKKNLKTISNNEALSDKYNERINNISSAEYDKCEFIKFTFDDEQNKAFSNLILVNSITNPLDANDYYINEKDTGKLAIINRYQNGLEKLKTGYYRNPFLFSKLIEPTSLRINTEKEINPIIIDRYQLDSNKNQKEAVKKAINIDNFFYLQGPPGTGKTQTICAIANQYALENKTILMTSQSHEAINNFFDRLDELNNDNPQLILIKYIADQQKNSENPYNVELAWKRFINKCINACDPNSSSNNYVEILNKLKDNNFTLPTLPSDYEIKMLNLNKDLIKSMAESNRFSGEKNHIENIIKENSDSDESFEIAINFYFRLSSGYWKKYIQDNRNQANLALYDELLSTLDKKYKLTTLFNDLNQIEQFINSHQQNNKYAALYRRKYLNSGNKLKNSKNFKDFIINNRLINIFGITTTSTTKLSLGTCDIDLFTDWPIDIVIIDEISKSNTPEIISRIILAKKVIFAGDYRQLPPKCDLDDSEIEDLVVNKIFNDKFLKDKGATSPAPYSLADNAEDRADKLKDWAELLYKDSFFAQEVKALKTIPNNDYAPYEHLEITHRSCSEIVGLVNIYYPGEELRMPDQPKHFKNYLINLTASNSNILKLDEPVILIDTSLISKNINDWFNNDIKIKCNSNISFDTKKWKKYEYTSAVNTYDAIIIANLIVHLFSNKANQLNLNDVGVITMTRSQKSLIRTFLKQKGKEFSQIKVDTVDNFQGREAEIIILDFVRSWGLLSGNSVVYPDTRELKFYLVNERINVALSRAKAKLIIVGSFNNHYLVPTTIKNFANFEGQFKFLYEVHKYIKDNQKIIDGSDIVWEI